MPAAMQFRIFCLRVSCLDLWRSKYTKLLFYLCFCMGVKPCLPCYGKNINWRCLRTGCLGEYLDLRGMKWQEVGENFLNAKLRCLNSSPGIVRVIRGRRIRWAGHVARMGEVRGTYNILVWSPDGRRPLERPIVDGTITLRWILGKEFSGMWIVDIWLGLGHVAGSCAHGDDPSGCIICCEFLD
jgi:hypothetical protein